MTHAARQLSAAAWLRSVEGSGWWHLPSDHLRVALTLIMVAEDAQGELVVMTTLDELSRRCGAARGVVHRALGALTDAGFCRVVTARGRRGQTAITLIDTAQTLESPKPEHSEHSQPIEMIRDSQENPGERGHFDSTKSQHLGLIASIFGRPDLGLLRSPFRIPDLRSSTPEDLSRSETKIPDHETAIVEGDEAMPEDDDTEPVDFSENADAKPRKSRVDPAKVPERAWAAADYLRLQVLEENAAAVVGTRPWQSGWRWPSGSRGVRDGDGSRTGLRLAWANSFRLLHGRLLKAMRNATPATTADDTWNEISRAVHWLFHDQPETARFVCESPDSIRDKWDRIQTARRRQQRAPARGSDGRPDPHAARELTRWGG
jgi:hypothetical protein